MRCELDYSEGEACRVNLTPSSRPSWIQRQDSVRTSGAKPRCINSTEKLYIKILYRTIMKEKLTDTKIKHTVTIHPETKSAEIQVIQFSASGFLSLWLTVERGAYSLSP